MVTSPRRLAEEDRTQAQQGLAVEDQNRSLLGLDRLVQPGQPFAVITAAAVAGERADVLEHQMYAV